MTAKIAKGELAIPVLEIEVAGQVTSSSLPQFAEAFRAGLAELNTDLQTDEQFGQAELDVKQLKVVEKAITDAKAKALEQAEEVNQLFSSIDELSEEAREARLKMEKQIKTRKEEVKAELIADGINRLDTDLRNDFRLDFQEAIKGKRNLRSMDEAILKVVIATNARLEANREIIAKAEAATPGIAPDTRSLETMETSLLEAELMRRKDIKEAEEAKKKAQADAEAAREAEAKAKAEAEEAKKPAPLPPAPNPKEEAPLPPQSSAQVSSSSNDPEKVAAEWEIFEGKVTALFASLRVDKERLLFDENQAKAAAFAAGVNAAREEVSP